MYKNVKLIIKDEDKDLKVKPIENYSFALSMAQSIVGIDELFKTCLSYPVLFNKGENNYNAVAFMGLKDGQNLFINSDGVFKEDSYIPSNFRKYPFIYVKDNDKLHLAYDQDSKSINKKSGEALFDNDGNNTKYLENVVTFMNSFQNSLVNMEQYIKQLDDAGVLEESVTNINNGQYLISGFYKVNEEKLNSLDKYVLRDLVKSGAYKVAIAHLLSHNNFEKLANLQSK